MTISLLLIDDHAAFLEHAARYLGRQPGLYVLGTARTGGDGLRQARARQPNVILLDLDLAGENGLDVLPGLKQAAPSARILILTHHDDGYRRPAVQAGADGFVSKSAMTDLLVGEIRRVMELSGVGV